MTTRAVTAKQPGNRFSRFFTGIWSEMKKVVWLSRREIVYLTSLVLIVTIAVGIVLYVFDLGFSTLVEKFIIN
jgi:preprotein translocase subunit SecE